MSILRYVKTNQCPICGCNTIINENIQTEIDRESLLEHCHGGRWETRDFICGMTIKYEPNFSNEQYDRLSCRKNPEKIELIKKKTEMFEEAKRLINGLNQDEDFKEVLLERIENARYSI